MMKQLLSFSLLLVIACALAVPVEAASTGKTYNIKKGDSTGKLTIQSNKDAFGHLNTDLGIAKFVISASKQQWMWSNNSLTTAFMLSDEVVLNASWQKKGDDFGFAYRLSGIAKDVIDLVTTTEDPTYLVIFTLKVEYPDSNTIPVLQDKETGVTHILSVGDVQEFRQLQIGDFTMPPIWSSNLNGWHYFGKYLVRIDSANSITVRAVLSFKHAWESLYFDPDNLDGKGGTIILDTFWWQDNATTNYNTNGSIFLGNDSAGSTHQLEAGIVVYATQLLTIAGIATPVTVTDATFALRESSVTSTEVPIVLCEPTTDWAITAVTWNLRPTLTELSHVNSTFAWSGSATDTINDGTFEQLIEDQINGDKKNRGFALKATNTGTSRILFVSTDAGTTIPHFSMTVTTYVPAVSSYEHALKQDDSLLTYLKGNEDLGSLVSSTITLHTDGSVSVASATITMVTVGGYNTDWIIESEIPAALQDKTGIYAHYLIDGVSAVLPVLSAGSSGGVTIGAVSQAVNSYVSAGTVAVIAQVDANETLITNASVSIEADVAAVSAQVTTANTNILSVSSMVQSSGNILPASGMYVPPLSSSVTRDGTKVVYLEGLSLSASQPTINFYILENGVTDRGAYNQTGTNSFTWSVASATSFYIHRYLYTGAIDISSATANYDIIGAVMNEGNRVGFTQRVTLNPSPAVDTSDLFTDTDADSFLADIHIPPRAQRWTAVAAISRATAGRSATDSFYVPLGAEAGGNDVINGVTYPFVNDYTSEVDGFKVIWYRLPINTDFFDHMTTLGYQGYVESASGVVR